MWRSLGSSGSASVSLVSVLSGRIAAADWAVMSDIGCFLVLNGYRVLARHLGGRQRGSAADLKFLNRKRRGFEVGKTLAVESLAVESLAVESLAVETWGVETDHELG